MKRPKRENNSERGAIELVVIGLVVSLILLIAIPFVSDLGEKTDSELKTLCMYYYDGENKLTGGWTPHVGDQCKITTNPDGGGLEGGEGELGGMEGGVGGLGGF